MVMYQKGYNKTQTGTYLTCSKTKITLTGMTILTHRTTGQNLQPQAPSRQPPPGWPKGIKAAEPPISYFQHGK